MKQKRVVVLILPVLIAGMFVALLAEYMRASEMGVDWGAENLVVIADTSATMQPELEALANAFPGSVIRDNPLERTYHMVVFTDVIKYMGKTNSPVQFKKRLSGLTAEGGEGCEGAMLQALAAAARGAPDSRALVLSDAAPLGGRSNLAFIMNKLVERGVSVYPLVSGWCDSSELSQTAMFSLARMTGGVAYIHEQGETETAAHSTLDIMAMRDSLLVENATLDDIKIYPLELDSTATTLGVEDKPCKPTW